MLRLSDQTGVFPYGFNLYGLERVYISRDKWKRRQWALSLVTTVVLSLFLVLKYAYMVIWDGFILLQSLNILGPVIIYCAATVIQLNLFWKLEGHVELLNQFYIYMNQFQSK